MMEDARAATVPTKRPELERVEDAHLEIQRHVEEAWVELGRIIELLWLENLEPLRSPTDAEGGGSGQLGELVRQARRNQECTINLAHQLGELADRLRAPEPAPEGEPVPRDVSGRRAAARGFQTDAYEGPEDPRLQPRGADPEASRRQHPLRELKETVGRLAEYVAWKTDQEGSRRIIAPSELQELSTDMARRADLLLEDVL